MKLGKNFGNDIRELIRASRSAVVRGVDLVQVRTSFEIGRRIVEEEQHGKGRAAYGKEIIKTLAERLTDEFGDGFSKRNLELMRRFYLMYVDRQPQIAQAPTAQLISAKETPNANGPLPEVFPIAQSSTAQSEAVNEIRIRPFNVSWTHYVFLLGVKDPDERSFYEIESAAQNWTVRELKRQFDSSLYERLALSRDKKGIRNLARQGQIITRPQDLLKEPLVLEFLGLDEKRQYSESDLESAIITQIEHFLLEMGKGFLFEARQRRFTFDGEHYHVDLVFYNRLLRCYVLIDLKIGKLTHQDLGQMQMYVNYYDRNIKIKGENSTVGIVLCKQQNKAVVEITLPKEANIHAREYRLYLPSKAELKQKLIEWAREGEGRS